MNDFYKILGVDIASVPLEKTSIISHVEPKKKSKYKWLQQIYIKLFGYEIKYKEVDAKKVIVRAEDFPKDFNGNITIKL